MTPRVKEILDNYGAENPGVLGNLAPILNHGRLGGTGKLVILPVDQGFEHGPARSFAVNPPAYDPLYHFELAIEAGCNAYAAPLGFIEAGARRYAGEIPLILKLNDADSLREDKDPLQAPDRERRRRSEAGRGRRRFYDLSRVGARGGDVCAIARAGRRSQSRWLGGGGLVLSARLGSLEGGRDRH